jgi:hypothetical protein
MTNKQNANNLSAHLSECTLAYGAMEVEVVEVDLAVKVDWFREAAADAPHGSLLERRKRQKRHGQRGLKAGAENKMVDFRKWVVLCSKRQLIPAVAFVEGHNGRRAD